MFSALLGSSQCPAYLNPDGTASLFGLPLRRLNYTIIDTYAFFIIFFKTHVFPAYLLKNSPPNTNLTPQP